MADLSPADITRLKEDLTIQQVILESLQSEDFDGVEQEREDAQDEIKRLTGLLKAATTAAAASGTCAWIIGCCTCRCAPAHSTFPSLRFCFFKQRRKWSRM